MLHAMMPPRRHERFSMPRRSFLPAPRLIFAVTRHLPPLRPRSMLINLIFDAAPAHLI